MMLKKYLKIIVGILIMFFMGITVLFYYQKSKEIVLTQYMDSTGNQAMFYTIESADGLIVVDGGWGANADYVCQIIKDGGGIVNAWILTHPHPDHIGAFNQIYVNPEEIEIEEIYTIDMDYDLYRKEAKKWDDFSVYDTFVQLTAEEDLIYLHTGDELEICGLKIQVFSAYDETITDDVANLGSLVFRVEGNRDSILFCSDVYGEEMSNRLVENYGDDLKSTYLQMGHHGNNSIKQNLVDCVQPKVSLFDAPVWLIYGEKYDTVQNIQMMQISGVECYTYETAPNQFVLR